MSPFSENFLEWFEAKIGGAPDAGDANHLLLSDAFETAWKWAISYVNGLYDLPGGDA